MITTDNDYSYIEVFIQFLREIIEIIKDLFSGIDLTGKKEEEEPAAEG